MKCPDCGERANVLDSRPTKDNMTRRRYECGWHDPPRRFTSFEFAEEDHDRAFRRTRHERNRQAIDRITETLRRLEEGDEI